MKKIYYRGDKIRCKARLNRSKNQIELRIQQKCWFWWVWQDWVFDIDIQIGPPMEPEPEKDGERCFPGLNPLIMSYVIGGYLEIWAAGTFDLEKRAEALLTEFCEKQSRYNAAKQELAQKLK